MSIYPRFKPCYRPEVIPSEGLFLLSEKGDVILTDPVDVILAPLLTGQHTLEDIFASVGDWAAPGDVMRSLLRLRQRGYVVDASSEVSTERAAFGDMLDVSEATMTERLQEARVSVRALGSVDAAPFAGMLEALGLRIGDDGDACVVLTDDYLHEELSALNARALANARTWLLVKPVGRSLWLGPVLVPGRTGCWECLAHRLRGHRKIETYVRTKNPLAAHVGRSVAALPTTLQAGLALAATEVYKWMVRAPARRLEGTVLTVDAITLEHRSHRLVRRPQCRACGTLGYVERSEVPPILQSRTKALITDGGHRSATPRDTFDRLAHHISPITGIVGSLHRVGVAGAGERVAPSYVADYAPPSPSRDLPGLLDALARRAGGKGKTDEQARMSALGEAIERYCGFFQGDEPRVRGSLVGLGDAAIHPNACMGFSQRQIERRALTNPGNTHVTWVPAPFDETMELDWTPVYSLTHGVTRYVPTAYCYYGYAELHGVEIARANSNGCAAGTNREEASACRVFWSWSSAMPWQSGGPSHRSPCGRSRRLRRAVHPRASGAPSSPASRSVGPRRLQRHRRAGVCRVVATQRQARGGHPSRVRGAPQPVSWRSREHADRASTSRSPPWQGS